MTPTTDLQKLCRDYDPEATEYENILSEAQWRRRNHDRQRGAIRHMGPDEKMHVEYWTWIVTNELAAARVLELEAENKRLRASLKRMLLEVDFMIETNGQSVKSTNDVIFVEARAALKRGEI